MTPAECNLLLVVAYASRAILSQIERTGGPSSQVGETNVRDCILRLDQAMTALVPDNFGAISGYHLDKNEDRDHGPRPDPATRFESPAPAGPETRAEAPEKTAEAVRASLSIDQTSAHPGPAQAGSADPTVTATRKATNRLLQAVDRFLYWDMAKGPALRSSQSLIRELEASAIALAQEVGWSRGAWTGRS